MIPATAIALALVAPGPQTAAPAASPPLPAIAAPSPAPEVPLPPDDVAKLPAAARALEGASPAQLAAPAPRHAPGDPLEGMNRRFFRSHQKLDHAIFRPLAIGYRHALPRPARDGLRNLFSNLGEPFIAANYVLQIKPGKALATLARFLINSIGGLGGLFDVAKRKDVNLPHRPNSLGDTLAFYGVKPGPYLFLPFVGPTTLRDLIGNLAGARADALILPFVVGTPFDEPAYQISKTVLTGLDTRAEADDDLKALFSGAVDPYATLRSVYLQNRAGEIAALKGRPKHAAPASGGELTDPLADPATPAPPTSATPELSDPLADPAAPPTSAAPTSTAPELNDPLADPAAPASDPAVPARR